MPELLEGERTSEILMDLGWAYFCHYVPFLHSTMSKYTI